MQHPEEPRLDAIPRAEVCVLGAPNAATALARLEASTRARPGSRRVVARIWSEIPELDALLDHAVTALATAAGSLWPAWYGRVSVDAEPASPSLAPAADRRTLAGLVDDLGSLAVPWAEVAFARCRAARLPIVHAAPRAVQAEQLALALEPEGLTIVLACTEATPPDARLAGLARAAAWLAGEARARVALIVPETWLDRTALEPVLYGAVRLAAEVAPPAAAAVSEHVAGGVRVFPVLGRPHPLSPGEQRLAERLARDAELGGLFVCNERVRTARGSEPLCDLHWAAGRLVVEIDGEGWHSERWAFRADRHRDYELLATGYRVLRLPHEEVMEDLEIAVEKIRDIVRVCRG